ncbi:maleylpyruvate isomerase family mycothiol-dependent enzyme [Amycolatopsis aidingensis]|uniref:maleylpyruvate isomerase family mycothiol-dependent enzyme n=1 Tax=Amycolatopsis aidingensis TaxID=2842453 RepID=UPI001C0C1F78|nr:maleylpyruvate isomerase family mycothiol-dependent enzyme [Amycolatopsis aidingensis]
MPQQTPTPRVAAATRVTPQRWAAARAAVQEAGDRFADLIRLAPDPAAMATKDWSIADTAAHVTGIAWNYPALFSETERPLPIPEVRPHMPTVTVDTIHTDLNPVQLRSFTERDPARLADRLRDAIADMLSTTAEADPGRVLGWLGGSQLPLAGLFAHMTNELLVHGWDIARAIGTPWRIPEEQAALFFDLFLVEIVRNGYGKLLDDDRPVRPGRIAVEFQSAYTSPATMVLDHGEASVVEPNGDRDIRIRFRPATLNLVLFRRIGHLRAAGSGALTVWGRRPWLLPAFLRKVRMP